MKTVIIDVRTIKEFKEGSYPGAINLPSENFNVELFKQFKSQQIALLCSSGSRANKIKNQLILNGFTNVTVLQNQMIHIDEGTNTQQNIWTVDRQFRLAIGLFIGFFLIDEYLLKFDFGLILLSVVFTGLIYSVITDNCYLKSLITILPWNRK